MGKSHLIVDRDRKYTVQFGRVIAESRTAVIRLPPRSPNLNARALRALDQRGMSGPDDLCRAGIVTPCYWRVRCSLSYGARSPRRREPIAPARSRPANAESTSAAASAPRWDAEFLLWSGCVDVRRSIWTIRGRGVDHARARLRASDSRCKKDSHSSHNHLLRALSKYPAKTTARRKAHTSRQSAYATTIDIARCINSIPRLVDWRSWCRTDGRAAR